MGMLESRIGEIKNFNRTFHLQTGSREGGAGPRGTMALTCG